MNMHDPAHSGEILKELIIEPTGITITGVSAKICESHFKKSSHLISLV